MLEIITPASTGHLTTLARVKDELSISGAAEDARLATLIGEASDLITAYCNRDTFGAEVLRQTERLSMCRDCIILARDLAPAITSITFDGTALTATEYEMDGALLYRLSDDCRVAWRPGKVVVNYTAGYTLLGGLPQGIERAAVDLVVMLYRGAGRDATIRQEMVEGIGSTSYFDQRANAAVMPLSADRLSQLSRYRLHGFA
jgi:hypothetical protein